MATPTVNHVNAPSDGSSRYPGAPGGPLVDKHTYSLPDSKSVSENTPTTMILSSNNTPTTMNLSSSRPTIEVALKKAKETWNKVSEYIPTVAVGSLLAFVMYYKSSENARIRESRIPRDAATGDPLNYGQSILMLQEQRRIYLSTHLHRLSKFRHCAEVEFDDIRKTAEDLCRLAIIYSDSTTSSFAWSIDDMYLVFEATNKIHTRLLDMETVSKRFMPMDAPNVKVIGDRLMQDIQSISSFISRTCVGGSK